MCQIVYYKEEEIDTIGELRKVVKNVVFFDGYGDVNDDSCLCPVDLDSTFYINDLEYKDLGCLEYRLL